MSYKSPRGKHRREEKHGKENVACQNQQLPEYLELFKRKTTSRSFFRR